MLGPCKMLALSAKPPVVLQVRFARFFAVSCYFLSGLLRLHAQFAIAPCAVEEDQAGVEILWPRSGQILAPTLTPLIMRAKIWGSFTLKKDGFIMAIVTGTDADKNHELSTFNSLKSAELNFEVFGLQNGKYFVQVFLLDHEEKTRSCWLTHSVSFTVAYHHEKNRSAALQRNLKVYEEGFRGKPRLPNAFLLQPSSPRDFAYVTILWSEDFVDNAIVWAMGLVATGSTFRRICMIGKGQIAMSKIQILSRCCCDIDIAEPVQAPGLSSKPWGRYALILTKLRVLQLDRKGLRKIVMMDADTLVLQNIDELFWLPSPSATVNKDTLMGELEKPKLSAGIMVLQPDSARFDELLADTDLLENVSQFAEQDLLDAYFNHSYNIIPLTYNLYPELLDLMPFLHPQNAAGSCELPVDNGIKVVHFWHLFNPFQISTYMGAHYLQLNAKLVHLQIQRWYRIFWRLHQQGLQLGSPNEYAVWQQKCEEKSQFFGQGQKFVPVLSGGGLELCRHVEGFAE